MQAQAVPLSQAVVRLDGQYGNGAIVADLAGLAYVMRGKDYDLLESCVGTSSSGSVHGSADRPS
jgi:hypothetical protein